MFWLHGVRSNLSVGSTSILLRKYSQIHSFCDMLIVDETWYLSIICCPKLPIINHITKWCIINASAFQNVHNRCIINYHVPEANTLCEALTPTPPMVLSLPQTHWDPWKEWVSQKHQLKQIGTQVTTLSRISSGVLTSQCDLCVAHSHDHNWSGQRSRLMDGVAREAALCHVCICVQF